MNVLDHFAAILWYSAGAVIPWERAAPEVQERYRSKARDFAEGRREIDDRYRDALRRIADQGNRGDISSEAVRDLKATAAFTALREVDAVLHDDPSRSTPLTEERGS